MYRFTTRNGARFFCRTDFSKNPVLNLHFFDASRTQVLFHLSLRHDEKLAVVNRRDAAGWRREQVWPIPFARRGAAVEIVFQGGAVRVTVDGRMLGRFDRFPRPDAEGRFYLRRGYPGLSAIAYVDIRGDHAAGSLNLRPLPQFQPLELTDRLELLCPASGGKGARLEVPGLDTPLPTTRLALPYGDTQAGETALVCILPGRIWNGAGEKLDLRLVDAQGAELAQTTLTRAQIAARIELMARTEALENDQLAALQVIEHCRMGRLFPRLGAESRARVAAAAEHFGLSDWLFCETGTDGDAPAVIFAPLSDEAGTQAVYRAHDRFNAAMHRAPESDPIAVLRDIQHDSPLPAPNRRALVLRLVEWFCIHADPRALHALALDEGLEHFTPGPDPWHNTAVMPFLYLDAKPEQLCELLTQLVPPSGAWIATSPIGWTARQVALSAPDANGRPLDEGPRLALIRAFLRLIEARAQDYWDHASCLSLMDAMAELLVLAETFPRALHGHIIDVALKAYGLSPAFWAILSARRAGDWPDPPQRITAMQARFERLAQLLDDRAQGVSARAEIEAILAAFERLGTFDTARFRRELLGAAGIALENGHTPEPDALLTAGLDAEEAALRYLAFPHAEAPAPSPALLDAAQRGLPAAYEAVPRAPNARLQGRLGQQAVALLAGQGDAPAEFMQALTPLARAQSGFVGFALGLSVATGLAQQGRDTAELITWLSSLLDALPLHDRQALSQAAAPAMAMQALRRHLPDHPLRTGAEALFGTFFPSLPTPDDDRATDLTNRANPLFDTLVAIYSCKPNLETRVAAMRAGWMQLLEGLGVPFLVFVGDGDGRRVADVVHLDAPDDYEGLPQKTLAMVRWVHDHTAFSYLLKIDDDCFLDTEAFFLSLSHLKFDYYGRPLHRVPGQMDRTWHMAKSRSDRGRLELDKSPEPSRYADGGSGYSLSRRAMAALIQVADSAEGQALAQLSFMEDKLVGDLLSMRDIAVSGEDYRIAIMRRTRPGGPMVSAWENGFLPFSGGGVKLVHLDGHERQAEVLAQSRQPFPRPAKVWPGYQPVRLGGHTNTLDLISSPQKLARVNSASVAVVACLRNEAFMLPHFLAHYRKLGVDGFLIADNGSDDGTLELLADQPDVALFSVDTEYSQSHYGVAWQQALLGNFRTNRWSVVADADEFLFWRTDVTGSLPKLVERPEFASADAAQLFMLDMYPQGPLADADFASGDPFAEARFCEREPFRTVSGGMGPYTNAPVVTSALRHRLLPGSRPELFVAQKTALLKYRPWMRLSAGLHAVAETRLAARPLFIAHFKYNSAFRAKAQAEVSRRQHFNNAEEYRKYLGLVAEGRDSLFDPSVSVPFDECDFVRQFCARD